MSDETGSSNSPSTSDISIFPQIQREDIELGGQLGVGSFGAVYRGTWTRGENTKVVALKKVFVLEKEAEILSKIRHRHIIQFYGICRTEIEFFIVTEIAENGSLYSFLHRSQNILDFKLILKWAAEIASGLQYLHYDAVVPIIHRDLKSKNVVLTDTMSCKICDFGTSKDLTHSCTAPTWGGTAAWMRPGQNEATDLDRLFFSIDGTILPHVLRHSVSNPEIINQKEGLTIATDVWSYGVVLWELLSREIPYKDFTEFRIYTLITQQGVTLVIPDSCPKQLHALLEGCWKMNPKERMSMKKILFELLVMEQNPVIKQECQQFIEKEDWATEIAAQKKHVENLKEELQRKKEQLESRERALMHRMRMETAVLATAESAKRPPEDVHNWSEHHAAFWIGSIIDPMEKDCKFGDKVKSHVFKHRITGARLLEMTQKDLEHLGITKLGYRMEVMRHIKKLREQHCKFQQFPTLDQARKLELAMKETGRKITTNTPIVLILGMYCRSYGSTHRFKFYVDSDWADEGTPSTSSSAMIKSVCFSVLDGKTKKPLNEPKCVSNQTCFAMDCWLQAKHDLQVNLIVNVHYADVVSEPRSTEMHVVLSDFANPMVLIEKDVELRIGRTSSSSSPHLHLNKAFPHVRFDFEVTSSPQLRGIWQRRASDNRFRNDMDENAFSIQPFSETVQTANSNSSKPKRKQSRRQVHSISEETENAPEAAPMVVGGKNKWKWKNNKKASFY